MKHFDELMDLRAERMTLLSQLNLSSNAKRQIINKKLMRVSKKIQKLAGVHVVVKSENAEI
ncbi:hypothetical protein K2X85_09990 [bacterium]|jgi:hypothetical protein|nr:hypothetical protein [bacterium]